MALDAEPSSAGRTTTAPPLRKSAVIGRGDGRGQPTSFVDRSPLRWTWLSYRLPTGPSRHRVSIWRELRRVRAINLELGTWALRHDEHGCANLDRLLPLIESAKGDYMVHDVRDASPRSAGLQDQLARTCDRLWDNFFNEADRLDHLCDVASAAESTRAEVEDLRDRFLSIRLQDVTCGDASHRADRKLSTLVDHLDAADPRPRDQREIRRPHGRRSWASIRVSSDVRTRQDGTATYVATVDPRLSIAGEHALAEFESAVLLPDDDRLTLTHNVYEFTCTLGAKAAVESKIIRRLDLFARCVR